MRYFKKGTLHITFKDEALWAKFTGGERLAYGCGYRDAIATAQWRHTAQNDPAGLYDDNWDPRHD